MNNNAHRIHEELVCDTVLAFARRALTDSALAQCPDGPTPCPLVYEISNDVPSAYGSWAFHVHVALELMDGRKADAEISFTVEDPGMGDAYVHDPHALCEGFDDPTKTLEWNEGEGLWESAELDV